MLILRALLDIPRMWTICQFSHRADGAPPILVLLWSVGCSLDIDRHRFALGAVAK